ncbi:MAG: PP2C family protein-serine/threonine phosphatase [Thermoanaerobaculia bacterium]
MRELRPIAGWVLAGLAGALLAGWAFPRAYPFFPGQWTLAPSGVQELALEHLQTFAAPAEAQGAGGWPDDPYVVLERTSDVGLIERRLLATAGEVPLERLQASALARRVIAWRVTVYRAGAFPGEWAYRADVTPDGRVIGLIARVDPELELAPLDPDAAVAEARAFLRSRGIELDRYGPPEVRSRELRSRTDLVLRYPVAEDLLGEGVAYGLEVHFAGDRLAGFETFYEDAAERQLQAELQSTGLWQQVHFLASFLVAALVAVAFLRRYHAGEVGVRRGLQIFAAVLVAGAVLQLLISRSVTEGLDWGVFTRQQVTWVWGLQFLVLFFAPQALAAFLSWSVGESLCREGWGQKLAAFDALFHGAWDNATVARASLRGLGAGLGLLGGMLALAVALRPAGAWPQATTLLSPFWMAGPLPGLALLALSLVVVPMRELFGRLFLVPWATRRMGLWLGASAATLLTGIVLFPALSVTPLGWGLVFAILPSAALVALFLRWDLLTVLVASLVLEVGAGALALISTESPVLQAQGWLLLAVPALPAALSVRALGSGREFVYRWDDVPPHVRRIAQRERQRIELETARRIQSTILPELPPRLAGVDLAHAYLPASEVGGDFYDVLALEDGRLALALGDVAGHGVSSGLVMSAAKSALAVQVTFDPSVESVFATLNRMVYQSARRRLIATLCYALLDPARRELVFASAGHLYPYVIGTGGRVRELASTAYPLGVRPELEVAVTREELSAGEILVLLSDGVVEAHRDEGGGPYGFERLESSLGRYAGCPVEQVRDGILADLDRFTDAAPRKDDQTLLVLRIP